jgi:hypothetical protein
MKRNRFAVAQIIAMLKDGEAGAKTSDLACKHGVAEHMRKRIATVKRVPVAASFRVNQRWLIDFRV